jgi:hypothetical protein
MFIVNVSKGEYEVQLFNSYRKINLMPRKGIRVNKSDSKEFNYYRTFVGMGLAFMQDSAYYKLNNINFSDSSVEIKDSSVEASKVDTSVDNLNIENDNPNPSVEVKVEEVKVEEVKVEEVKVEEVKPKDVKVEEVKPKEVKPKEVKRVENKKSKRRYLSTPKFWGWKYDSFRIDREC